METSKNNKPNRSTIDKKRLLKMMLEKKGVKTQRDVTKDTILKRQNDGFLPLSSAQQRLWFIEEFTVGTAAYVFCNKTDLNGVVDLDALKKSYQTIISRHEIFRTSYAQEDGVPHQIIHPEISIDIPLIDLSSLDKEIRQKKYDMIVHEESTLPFKLGNAPLMRMCIIKMAPEYHVVLQTIHHIVYDGWSLSIMYDELKVLYESYVKNKENPLTPLEIQYADFSIWQKNNLDTTEMQKQLKFWKTTLSGELPVLEFQEDKARAATQSYNGSLHKINLTESLSESLRIFALKNECTLSMVLLTAFKILLSRYTGETDILVGMPIANRNHKQTENLIGFFVNSLVLRTSLDFDPTVEELLLRVRESSSKAYSNQDVPFDRIVEEIQPARDLSHNPIFQVMFAFQNTPSLPDTIANLKIKHEVLDNNTSIFDLTLNLHDSVSGEGIYGYIEYCSDLYNADTIERMQGHYQTILEGMIANSKNKISQLQFLTKKEEHNLLIDWNDTKVDYNVDQYIHTLIEKQAENKPDSVAVYYKNNKISYTELNKKANQLARHLIIIGVKPDSIIGICIERCSDMLVSILAVLKAGAAYLPLDPSYPSERLAFMLQDTEAQILLSHEYLLDDLSKESLPKEEANIFCLDRDWNKLGHYCNNNIEIEFNPNNLAYIIYTSGSTGKPKGVMVSHRNLVHSTLARIHYYKNPIDKFLLLSSFSFDSSVAGIFWTLCQGGELHLPIQGMEKDIVQVAALLQEAKASHILSLPSIYSLLLSVAEPNQLQSLNTIIVAGEACPIELSQQHSAVLPQADLYNEYGPTEGSVWSTVYEIPIDKSLRHIPIGKPIPNVKTYILDGFLKPVPIGVVGEIYIGGKGITRGYLNRSELTTERFIQSPFNGKEHLYRTGDLAKYQADSNILFCGRVDDQVKIRGYRIELGEIESAILNHNEIKDVVVLARETNSNNDSEQAITTKRLIAYLVNDSVNKVNIEDLQVFLKNSLPEYMIPSLFVFLDEIPLSPNGKVNIKALPDDTHHEKNLSSTFIEAENEIEQMLADIWSSVLGVEKIGRHDNFFEIGGDSILSIQIVARTKKEGIFLTPKQVFQNLTIAELALVADTQQTISAEQGLITGEIPLIPIQHWLLERNLKKPEHWNQAIVFIVPDALDLKILQKSFENILIHHDALRSRFEKKNNQWVQYISDDILLPEISSYDYSSLSDEVKKLSFIDSLNKTQASLNISNGKLIGAAHFKMGNSEQDRLFVAIHHLVIDTVSWEPLIEDLEMAYKQLSNNDVVNLPEKTSSYKDWSKALIHYVKSNAIKQELDYWLSLSESNNISIPVDIPDKENTELSQRKIYKYLSKQDTESLIKDIPSVYNTKIDDVLLTALTQTINTWTGYNHLSIGMEGHGREQIDDNIDLSRTVGWFTSYFPVSLMLDSNEAGTCIKSVKDQLRRIPNHGLSFGVLQYLLQDSVITKKLDRIIQGNILYNYLGKISINNNPDAIFKLTSEDCGNDHDLSGERSHLLELDAMIVDGQLRFDWVYSNNIHFEKTINDLANDFMSNLLNLIQHCQSPDAGGYSASDFPEANLEQDELDDLLDMLDD